MLIFTGKGGGRVGGGLCRVKLQVCLYATVKTLTLSSPCFLVSFLLLIFVSFWYTGDGRCIGVGIKQRRVKIEGSKVGDIACVVDSAKGREGNRSRCTIDVRGKGKRGKREQH